MPFCIFLGHIVSCSIAVIQGESGTGKELFARAIHNLSKRKKEPFIAVNCGALPENLLESELFGYKKGAFTDAKKDKPGRFALAERGTFFLDEVSDLPLFLQAKLLRVLQEKEYEPLGATTTLKADVRIIAATNRDLSAMVRQKSFREDLFYRLNIVKIELPPLCKRKEDIPLLVNHFIKKLNLKTGKKIIFVSDYVIRPHSLTVLKSLKKILLKRSCKKILTIVPQQQKNWEYIPVHSGEK